MKKWLVAVLSVFVLAACGDEQEASPENLQKTIDEGTVGFEMMGGKIQEATGVPKGEAKKLLDVFNEYIEASNNKDIERYMKTISKNAKGLDYEEDKKNTLETFKKYDVKRSAEDITIIKYNDKEAHIYAHMSMDVKEIGTGNEYHSKARQVTLFIKEEGQWKISGLNGMVDSE
ncbi:nuclear transport factor 2 family protein [Solibacillus isronensis]|uniref:nuclear transport factor 2 family protein n=1 Tax=Solibacillus isronensis TaxID=412383 RepID=UPI00203ADB69|nr:nuclear transport factor 2 family protein [Solibacillus isronensis]MCM3722485.1 nuclear transport factor 2 family protein [Solibacillus isronensis]